MTSAQHLAGAVLAAGRSSRLGEPKQLIQYQGETLIARATRLLSEVCDSVVVVTGAFSNLVIEAMPADTRHVYNPHFSSGLSSSIRTAIKTVDDVASNLLLTTCDQPQVTQSHLQALIELAQQNPERCIASAYSGTVGIPAVFPSTCFARLAAVHGDRGAKQVLLSEPAGTLSIPCEDASFDVDTSDDVARLASF